LSFLHLTIQFRKQAVQQHLLLIIHSHSDDEFAPIVKSIDRYSTRLVSKVKTVVAAHLLGIEQERLRHLQFFFGITVETIANTYYCKEKNLLFFSAGRCYMFQSIITA